MSRLTHLRSSESGSAIIFALLMITVVAAAAVVISTSVTNSAQQGKRRGDSVAALPGADTAVARYQAALNSEVAIPRQNYHIRGNVCHTTNGRTTCPIPGSVQSGMNVFRNGDDRLDLSQSLQTVVRNRVGDPGDSDLTFVERSPEGNTRDRTFWQVYRVDPLMQMTRTGEPSVVAYFRIWTGQYLGNGRYGSYTEPRMIRASFRAGMFTDYQMLANSYIILGPGMVVNGKIHSNAYELAPPRWNGDNPGLALGFSTDSSLGPNARCTANARLTYARGNADLPNSCMRRTTAIRNRTIEFGRVQETYEIAESRCPPNGRSTGPVVICPGGRPTIRFHNRAVSVDGAWHTVDPIRGLVIYVEDDVRVWGTPDDTGRVTVIARRPADEGGAANISIINSVGPTRNTGSNLTENAIGLIAQGDVILCQDPSCGYDPPPNGGECWRQGVSKANYISAAIIAETGTLTLARQWLTPMVQSGAPFCPNGTLSIQGSVAANDTPILNWRWEETNNGHRPRSGWGSRHVQWDTTLRKTVPPLFPSTGDWWNSSWSEANKDCLSGSNLECV